MLFERSLGFNKELCTGNTLLGSKTTEIKTFWFSGQGKTDVERNLIRQKGLLHLLQYEVSKWR